MMKSTASLAPIFRARAESVVFARVQIEEAFNQTPQRGREADDLSNSQDLPGNCYFTPKQNHY